MIALKIEDLKHFTGQLFAGEAFDHWQVRDVSIVTFNTFTIDGRIRPAYYSEEERREQKIRSYSLWSSLRPFCYSLIRGKRLPESFSPGRTSPNAPPIFSGMKSSITPPP